MKSHEVTNHLKKKYSQQQDQPSRLLQQMQQRTTGTPDTYSAAIQKQRKSESSGGKTILKKINRFFDNSKIDSAYSHAGSKQSIGHQAFTRVGTNSSPSQTIKPQINVGGSPRQPKTENRTMLKKFPMPMSSMTPGTHKSTLQQFEDMKRKY